MKEAAEKKIHLTTIRMMTSKSMTARTVTIWKVWFIIVKCEWKQVLMSLQHLTHFESSKEHLPRIEFEQEGSWRIQSSWKDSSSDKWNR